MVSCIQVLHGVERSVLAVLVSLLALLSRHVAVQVTALHSFAVHRFRCYLCHFASGFICICKCFARLMIYDTAAA